MQHKVWVDEIWDKLDKKLQKVAPRSKNKLPLTAVNGVHDNRAENHITCWTNGFWGGLMWIMYLGTANELYKKVAETSEELLDKAWEEFERLHHDVGFMWHITSGVNYRLNGNYKSKMRNMKAASSLASRFNIKGEYIRAWNNYDWEEKDDEIINVGWSIIDSMMNIPLLYWASKEIKDPRFKHIAEAHANTVMNEHIREDSSVRHIVVHDHINGGAICEGKVRSQGYDVGSSWSRGQAWAIYGFILSYIHTQKQEYLDAAKNIAHYFISCVCDDWLPRCDFRSPEEPIIYDNTAGAIAACGMLEIANHVGAYEKKIYYNAAINMLKAMEERFCNWDENVDNIVMMGTGNYHDVDSHHMPMIYGDYFFAEAIYKLKGNDFLFW